MFENWVLIKILGPKRHEMTGEWRRLRNEELCDLYTSPNIIRVMRGIFDKNFEFFWQTVWDRQIIVNVPVSFFAGNTVRVCKHAAN